MPRATWKGPFFVHFPQLTNAKNIKPQARSQLPPIRTNARACTILPNFVGLRFEVHNGKDYIPITVSEEMVGHKLGEFALTRKIFNYKGQLTRELPQKKKL